MTEVVKVDFGLLDEDFDDLVVDDSDDCVTEETEVDDCVVDDDIEDDFFGSEGILGLKPKLFLMYLTFFFLVLLFFSLSSTVSTLVKSLFDFGTLLSPPLGGGLWYSLTMVWPLVLIWT